MSFKDNDWWLSLVSRLQEESLANLCLEYGIVEEAVIPDLLEESGTRPIIEALWWPEAVRQVMAGRPVVDVASRFDVHARRLRKGLARAGIRVSSNPPGAERAASRVGSAAGGADGLPPDAENSSFFQRSSARQGGRSPEPLRSLSNKRLPRPSDDTDAEPAGKRRRPGRRRLVRPDAVDERAPEPAPVRRVSRKPKTSPHSEVRVIAPDALDLSELMTTPESAGESEPRGKAMTAPSASVPTLQAEPKPVPAAQAEPVASTPIQAPSLRVQPIEASLQEAKPPAAPAPAPALAPATIFGGSAWRIRLNGTEQSMVVIAADILAATELFAEQLGREALCNADIYSTPLL